MTPEEKAKEIVWACVCVTPSEQVDLERNIAQAIREAVAERDKEIERLRAALKNAAKVVRSAADDIRGDLTYSEDVEWIDAIADDVIALANKEPD